LGKDPVKARKHGGRYTEPAGLPPHVIVSDSGVAIVQYYRGQDHGPPHLHVTEGENTTRIGQNGYPLRHDPPLTAKQAAVVSANPKTIRKAIRRIGRWHWFNQQ
jgi:hypothetical protein